MGLDVKNLLKSAFPYIAGAAGVGGPLAVMAANAVGQGLGIDTVEPSAEGIANAIANSKDPDVLLKLKQVESDFQLKMAQLGIDSAEKFEEFRNQDRANARAREIAVKDKTPAVLAYAVTVGFFSLLGLMCFHAVPESSQRILDVMVGSLGTAWIGIITYYFGSSAGSEAKNAIIERITTAGSNVVHFVKKATA